jgi:hypothetical protein
MDNNSEKINNINNINNIENTYATQNANNIIIIQNNDEINLNNSIIDTVNFHDKLLKDGAKILKENKFFYDLEKIMKNDEFSSFYNTYFKNFNDIKTVLMYMKLYETIEKEYLTRYNKPIEKEILAKMMKEIMTNTRARKQIIKSFNEFADPNNTIKNISILDIFEHNKILDK